MFDDKLDLTISRIIRAPRARVWEAWVDPRKLEQWWAPVPVKTKVNALEVKAGGAFDTTMTLPDGTVMDSKGCILEATDQERIVFTDAVCGGWRPNPSPFMTAIITMSDHADGTQYAAHVMHHSEADKVKHEEMGFHDGWGTAIKQLADLVE